MRDEDDMSCINALGTAEKWRVAALRQVLEVMFSSWGFVMLWHPYTQLPSLKALLERRGTGGSMTLTEAVHAAKEQEVVARQSIRDVR